MQRLVKYVVIQRPRPDLKDWGKEVLEVIPLEDLDHHASNIPPYTAPAEVCTVFLKEYEVQLLLNQEAKIIYTKEGSKLVLRNE